MFSNFCESLFFMLFVKKPETEEQYDKGVTMTHWFHEGLVWRRKLKNFKTYWLCITAQMTYDPAVHDNLAPVIHSIWQDGEAKLAKTNIIIL